MVSAQAGDEVYIDCKRVGLTPLTCAMAPGQYKLEVKRNGTVIDTEKIEVSDGSKLERKVR